MMNIRHAKTLFYHDGPQVFEASDGNGGRYIGVMVASMGELDRFLIKGVLLEDLRRFRSGLLDLRNLVVGDDANDWYLATAPRGLDEAFDCVPQEGSVKDSGFLPEHGFQLDDQVPADF